MIYLFLASIWLIATFAYWLTTKYEISDDSKINFLYTVIPWSKRYPYFIYLIGSYLFALPLWWLDKNVFEVFLLTIFVLLTQAITYIDIKCFRLPNAILLPMIVTALITTPFVNPWTNYLGGVYCLLIIMVLALIRAGGMTGGDMKLAGFLGLLVGVKFAWLGLLLGLIIGGVLSFQFLIYKMLSRKEVIPYGPFLFIGSWIMIIWGNVLYDFLF